MYKTPIVIKSTGVSINSLFHLLWSGISIDTSYEIKAILKMGATNVQFFSDFILYFIQGN